MKNNNQLANLQCLYCNQNKQAIYFYSCCLRSSCQQCHHNQIFYNCKQTKQVINNDQFSIIFKCHRCLTTKQDQQIYCQNCKKNFCVKCFNEVHNKGKFFTHKYKIMKQTIQQLICSLHGQQKNIMIDHTTIICPLCSNENKQKKGKIICGVNKQLIKNYIKTMNSSLENILENQSQKFNQAKQSMHKQYQLIKSKIQERLKINVNWIQKVYEKLKTNIEDLTMKMKLIKGQIQIFDNKMNNNKIQQLIDLRSFFLNEQINKIRKDIQKLEYYQYKLISPTSIQIDNFIKSFIAQKIKIKTCEDDQKQNKSLRKSRVSSGKLSYRQERVSQSKSISKKTQRSINSKINPIHKDGKQKNQITPLVLIYNMNNAQGSLSNLVQAYASKQQEGSSIHQKPKNNYMKRKADYLDMRDRMRKPSIINRFQKR